MAFSKPNPYIPSFLVAAVSGSRPITLTWGDVADTNIASTSSFQYDPQSVPLKSTQQLNVDWSDFTQHTFFMSAEAKVNLAFDSIINGYPFDGTRREVEAFFDKMSGFERWVFDMFPRFKGELQFSNTYIAVQDKTGALFPELSSVSSGQPVLNPSNGKSMTVEMQLFVPTVINDVQTVCQMMNGTTQGWTLDLSSSLSTSTCNAQFNVVSGSFYMSVAMPVQKGVFNHVAMTLNRDNGLPFLQAFLNSNVVATSKAQSEMGDLNINGSQLLIGSGTQALLGSTLVTPKQTLSGTLDEFRLFHSARTTQQQATYASKALYQNEDLVLYYRFNEPPPPIVATLVDPINAIVLDSSGNSLHALISNFTGSVRQDASADPLSPMTYERLDSYPVLFPAYPATVAFNQQLLLSASLYDSENPNLIIKLVPPHYLLEGAQHDGLIEPEGTANQPYGGSGIAGQGQMGNVQIMVSLLYIWARFFDEMKLYVDSFATLRTVDYDTNDTIPDNFLLDLVKSYGFYLPPLFNDSTIEQYVRGENVDLQDITTNVQTLRQVQNQLLRRVLVNIPDVLRSKGTQHSIKSFLRAVGIDPGNNVRIREFGGPTSQQLTFCRETKIEPGAMVQFTSPCLVVSPFLVAPRVEPGFPPIEGVWTQQDIYPPNGVSNHLSDDLLTSGSWTWEGIVRYTPAIVAAVHPTTQSLVRLCNTGSLACNSDGDPGLIANLLAMTSETQSKLVLYTRPGTLTTSPVLRLELEVPSTGIFNYDRWNVSFGRQRNDDGLDSVVSSSYFLRVAYQNDGRVELSSTTSSFFQEIKLGDQHMTMSNETNVFQHLDSTTNASGLFLAMGAGGPIASGVGSGYPFLNDALGVPDEARTTSFDGRLSNVRFWSKYVTDAEWTEHVRNYSSVGVEDPLTNWNYVSTKEDSFGKLRLNSLVRQDIRQANATASLGPVGAITFLDMSENGFHLTGSAFPIAQDIVVGEMFDYSYLSPYFDEASSNEKVRVRSYQDLDLVEQTPWAHLAPVNEIEPSEQPTDDVRLSVEFSLIDALNRDIVTIFSTFDALDNALGAPELLFSPDYPDLDRLRDVYFKRIKQKLNFQAFFEFFRWFDTSIGTFIQQLIPRKTQFKGVNFVVESHMLERAKQEYRFFGQYLGDSIRQNVSADILLQQITGVIRKH